MAITFKELMDKCIDDPVFRMEFLNDRVGTVKKLGVNVTPDLECALNDLDVNSIRSLAIAMQPKPAAPKEDAAMDAVRPAGLNAAIT